MFARVLSHPSLSLSSDLDPEIAEDIDLVPPLVSEREELAPSPVRNVTATGLAPPVAAGAAATKGAGRAPGTKAENAALKKGECWLSTLGDSQPASDLFVTFRGF